MKLVFITNLVHHHQIPVADELYKILGDDYKYISTEPLPEWLIKGGYDPNINRPYIIKPYESKEHQEAAIQLANNSDVVIIGAAPEFYVTNRIKLGKLTFRCSERWFKSKPWYLTGPRGWLNIYRYHLRYRDKPLYMLCASAFTAKDVNTIGAYRNKCFKWGYITKVDTFSETEALNQFISFSDSTPQIMWCARFLKLKHPELPVQLASRLKAKGYNFVLNMFGSGVELETIKLLAKKLNVEECVNFCGNRPNDEILNEMKRHQIFLFTSDRNEGWGAVLNEAMSCGCAVVGSDMIGSVPYLIEDGTNGCIFKSEDLNSLEEKVIFLLDNPKRRKELAYNAYLTMKNVWSPKNAAESLMRLIDILLNNNNTELASFGPCSKA